MNMHAGHSQLNLYRLLQLLHKEAQLAKLNVRLTSEGRMTHVQHHAYTWLHTLVADYWQKYTAGNRSAMRLLRACSCTCSFQM